MGLQQTLKALADPTRREILNLLKDGKRSAGEISEQFDISAAALKRILTYANKTAGYVVGRAGAIPAMPTGKEIFGK